jgi:hypothetical protein
MTPTNPLTLDTFLDRVRAVNPFLANRVDRPLAECPIDVPGIHEIEFRKVLALGRQAQQEDRGLGVLVWGEAGVGKSHLLARLARWAQQGPRALFIYLHNLQAEPERLPRYVLRCVLSVLTNGQAAPLWRCRLFHLLNAVLRKAIEAMGLARASWAQIESAFDRWLNHLAVRDPAGGALFDRTVYHVLLRFFQAAYPHRPGRDAAVAGLALRWLAGAPLDHDEARHLGLQAVVATAPADNQHVKQVLVALTRLARLAGQLFLLCFDQVDNLDEAQVQSLARFLHDLLDSAGNLLVVTTGVRQTLLAFRQGGVITETSWDRLAQVEILLNRIRQPAGRELLAAHLNRFLEPFLGLAPVQEQVRQDGLFPLGEDWFQKRLGHLTDFRPRDLLMWAGERWLGQQDRLAAMAAHDWLDHWREGVVSPAPARSPAPAELTAAVDQAVARRLADEIAARLRRPEELPPSDEHLEGLTARLLRRLGGRLKVERVTRPKYGSRPPYDLRVLRGPGEPETCVAVRFLVAEHGKTVTAALKRLDEDSAPPDRLVLVTDSRQPLPLGPEGKKRLERLRQRGPAFRHIELSFDDYAALDALQAVVDAARAGDVEAELPGGACHRVSDTEVLACYSRQGRHHDQPLLRELIGTESAVAPPAGSGKDALAEVSDREIRQFLAAQAALEDNVSLPAVAERFAGRLTARTGDMVDAARCLPRLRELAARMAADGQLALTPDKDGLRLPPFAKG